MSVLNNSVAFAQFRSRGGWKMTGILCGGYALIVIGLMFLTVRLDPGDVSGTMAGWMVALGVILTLILLIFGSTRVSGAVRQDLSGKMVESNRLMPISSAEAIVGYVVGAPSQAIALAAISVLLGCLCTGWSGVSVWDWLQINAYIALVMGAVWIMVAFGAFLMRGAPVVLFIPLILLLLSQGGLPGILPGFALMMMPLEQLVPSVGRGVSGLRFVDLAAIGSFLALAVIFFFGAARRYRRNDITPLSPLLGLLLLALWLTMSLFAMIFWYESRMFYFYYGGDPGRVRWQALGTLEVFILLAIIPVGAATGESIRWQLTAPEDRVDLSRPMPVIIVALMTAFLVLPLQCAVNDVEMFFSAVIPSALAVAMAMITLSMVIRVVWAVSSRRIVLPIVWILIGWIAPFFVDLICQSAMNLQADIGEVSTISPMGIIAAVWARRQHPPQILPGLLIQAGIMVFWTIMALRLRKPPIRLGDHPSPGNR